ncbi:hypothetical protein HNY73_015868 [Argiope bruennichi]|uniref:Uncharacterized protein n=1 Tax=Argiope bruennichi TaxID=94029 RepID=A0A8T0EHY6_ARGBR|nr:hypothetical protein HNY73_015868 [Argiope bruennichi]
MKGMRDVVGPMTGSALTKVMQKFETTGSFASRLRSGPSTASATVVPTVEQSVKSMSVVSAHGKCSAREVSLQKGLSYGCVWRTL